MRIQCCLFLPAPLPTCQRLASTQTRRQKAQGTLTIEYCCKKTESTPLPPPVDAGLGVLLRLRADTATDSTARRHSRAEDAAQHAETTSTRSSHLRLRHHLDRSTRGATATGACGTGGRAVGAAARATCHRRRRRAPSERGAARTGGSDGSKRRTDQQSDVGGLAHAGRGGFGGGPGWRTDAPPQRRDRRPGALRAAGGMYPPRLPRGPLEPAEPALRVSMSWHRAVWKSNFRSPTSMAWGFTKVQTQAPNTSATAPSRAARRRSPSSSRRLGLMKKARSSSRSGPSRTSARMFK